MNNFDISTLEQAVEKYPWFSLAHLELFKKMCELGEEQKRAYLDRAAAYLYSRERIYEISRGEKEGKRAIEHKVEVEIEERDVNEEITFEVETDPLHATESPKIILAGGDYFSRNDFKELKLDTAKPLDKFIIEKPTLLRSNPIIAQKEVRYFEETGEGENFEDSGFYTETLAKIYSEQGFYKRAIEVYAKLILLYPEKSSYFAALVKDLKNKHNQ